MDGFTKAVCDFVIDHVKASIDDPESQQVLRDYITQAHKVHKNLLPSPSPTQTSSLLTSKLTLKKSGGGLTLKTSGAKKLDTGSKGSATVSGYNLHWTDWHKKNPQKDYPDPENPTSKITAHQYWKKYVWDKMDNSEQDEWNQTAKDIRNKTNGADGKEKGPAKKRAHFLFVEKMKQFMDKDEEFEVTDPKSGEPKTKKTHHYLLAIWSQYLSKNADLKAEFEEIEKQINSGELDNDPKKYLAHVPYIDVEKVRNADFDYIELLHD